MKDVEIAVISDSQAIFRGEELRQDGAGTPWPAFFMRSRKNGIAFEVAFWVIFKSQVRVIMPHPGSNSHGSNSVPSHRCSGDLALIANHQEPRHEQPDIDALYHAVCPVLTEKERQVLFLALGLGCEGRLSNKEIAQSLGCVESNIRDIVNRAVNRIRAQVRSGSVTPPDIYEG